MITASKLDAVIDHLEEQQPDLARFYGDLGRDLPILVSFLTDEDSELLTDDEHDYLLYLAMVVIRLFQSLDLLKEDLDPELLGSEQERYWQIINDSSSRPLDKIWEQTPEDAVIFQFILESLALDDDVEFLTEAGVQIAFVKLAAMSGVIQLD